MIISTQSRHWCLAFSFFTATFFMACNATTKTESESTEDSSQVADSAGATQKGAQANNQQRAQATITGTSADTTVNGTATFEQDNGKVKMELNLTIPAKANKSVAVHLHEHGDCSDMGKGAHGHWNPTNKQHGKWGSDNFHSGDIGNVTLDAQGKGSLTLETNLWSIGGDSTTNILNRAVIVHGGVDDFVTQPTGNAGGRIGCGVIQ